MLHMEEHNKQQRAAASGEDHFPGSPATLPGSPYNPPSPCNLESSPASNSQQQQEEAEAVASVNSYAACTQKEESGETKLMPIASPETKQHVLKVEEKEVAVDFLSDSFFAADIESMQVNDEYDYQPVRIFFSLSLSSKSSPS